MSKDKEVGGYRTGSVKNVSPTYKDKIVYSTTEEAYPKDWDGSMGFHTERMLKNMAEHPKRTPKLGGGDGSVVPAPTCHCKGKSVKYAKTISGDKRLNKEIRP